MTRQENRMHRARSAARVSSTTRVRSLFTGVLLSIIPLAGCDTFDTLLDVDLPGQVTDADLSNPTLAETLMVSVEADFECAFQGHNWVTGLWAQEWHYTDQLIEMIRYGQRTSQAAWHSVGVCTSNREPIWRPMQQVRWAASNAIEVVQGLPEGEVENVDLLLGWGHVYGGYATQLIAEPFCGIVDGGDGVVRSREEGFQRAESSFTAALEHLERAVDGSRAAEAADLRNLALIGRARARLNLGNDAGVVEDASRVDEGYVRWATYDLTPNRRTNQFETFNQNSVHFVLHENFRPEDGTLQPGEQGYAWQVDGVDDPRLPVLYHGLDPSGRMDWYQQLKYAPSNATDLMFATWREAQLMIAEVEGGQVAVGIINRLRDTHDLPHFESTDESEIRDQVREERRRELFMHGTKLGDDLRWGTYEEWDDGETPQGQPYGNETCIPVPDAEFL